jgi:hypothetical protein
MLRLSRSDLRAGAIAMREGAPFDIAIDRPRRLLIVTLRGFWQQDVIEFYWRELDVMIKPLRDAGPMLCLIEASDFAVQSAYILKYYERLSEGSNLEIERVAMITTSTLLKLQIETLLPRRNIQQFRDHAAALEWLEAEP